MVMSELRQQLRRDGFGDVAAHVIRYGIERGHISRPPLNGSLSFDFQDQHVDEVREYLRVKKAAVPA